MDDENFKLLFQKIVEHYELSSEVATDLLQRILEILNSSENTQDSS